MTLTWLWLTSIEHNAYKTEQYGLAIDDCTKAIELDPNLAQAYINRAYAYNSTGQYDLTIADCNKAIDLDPNLAQPYFHRGFAYKGKGQEAEAIADFVKFITLTRNPEWREIAEQEVVELSKWYEPVL